MKRRTAFLGFVLLSALLPAISPPAHCGDGEWGHTDGWYTLAHDSGRSGRTDYSPGVPFEQIWHAKYWEELIGTEVEPIVAEGLVFFGTFKGILRALDAGTGAEKWRYEFGAPLHHSPSFSDGKIVCASMDGRVAAFDARSGAKLWTFKAEKRGGFVSSPAICDGAVFIGDRAGDLYSIRLSDGKQNWKISLGAMIQQTAAVKDGKLAIAAEDMIPRLISAEDGKEIWRAPRMDGATVRGYYPVFWNDMVVFRSEVYGIDAYQNAIQNASEEGKSYRQIREGKFPGISNGWSEDANRKIRELASGYSDKKFKGEQEFILEKMKDGSIQRSFYALKLSDGSEPLIYAVGYHSSENGFSVPPSPPLDKEGRLYVFFKSMFSEWPFPIRAFDAVGVLEPGNSIPHLIRGIDRSQGSFPATCDEVNKLTIAGDKLFDTHDHVLTYMDIETKKIFNAYSSHSPELWGGVVRCMPHEKCPKEKDGMWKLDDENLVMSTSIQWNGPMQGSVAVWKDLLFWNTGSMIICLKGASK